MTQDELDKRFNFHTPNPDQINHMNEVRTRIKQAAEFINIVVPEGREKALVFTHLEEAMFFANAGIVRHHDA